METITAANLKWYLGQFRYNVQDEESIQVGIGEALRMGNFEFEREPSLSPGDRLDFLVGGVAIEVKRNGALGPLLRQLSRYAEHEKVRELLVVTARVQATNLPASINGKPLECLVLLGSVFS